MEDALALQQGSITGDALGFCSSTENALGLGSSTEDALELSSSTGNALDLGSSTADVLEQGISTWGCQGCKNIPAQHHSQAAAWKPG